MGLARAAVLVLTALLLAGGTLWRGAAAQTREAQPAEPAPPEMRENCPGLVARDRPSLTPASLRLAALNPDQVRITFLGHASFLI